MCPDSAPAPFPAKKSLPMRAAASRSAVAKGHGACLPRRHRSGTPGDSANPKPPPKPRTRSQGLSSFHAMRSVQSGVADARVAPGISASALRDAPRVSCRAGVGRMCLAPWVSFRRRAPSPNTSGLTFVIHHAALAHLWVAQLANIGHVRSTLTLAGIFVPCQITAPCLSLIHWI
jgi:hypothetical protein